MRDRCGLIVLAFALASIGAPSAVKAAGPPEDDAFQKRIFGRTLGKAKTHACFSRAYDPAHLGQHPQQNVRTMLLLVTGNAEVPSSPTYQLGIGVTFRKLGTHFETMGSCGSIHAGAGAGGAANAAHCGVECDGGSIDVTLKDAKSVLVAIPAGARIWKAGTDSDDQKGRIANALARTTRCSGSTRPRSRTALDWRATRTKRPLSAAGNDRTPGSRCATRYLNEDQMHRRTVIQSAIASGAGALAAQVSATQVSASQVSGASAAEVPSIPIPMVVYHLSDIEKVPFVLGNVANHIEGMGGPDRVRIAIVVHGPPLRSFQADTRNIAIKSDTARLRQAGVSFFACANTMAAMKLALADLAPGFGVADKGGVVKLAELQGQGWIYLRP